MSGLWRAASKTRPRTSDEIGGTTSARTFSAPKVLRFARVRRTGQKHPEPQQLADLDSVDSDPPERDRPAGRGDAAESPFVCAEESPAPGDRLLHLARV